ncbi:hypothetical protein EV360DRAFT_9263, partial [Lentinula raphanica]
IQQAISEVITPSYIEKPPEFIGLPKAGTPKADNWRTLFSIFLPLALLSLWQEDSPVAAADANDMGSDRTDFREYLRLHIDGLKANFPGFIQPSHHLAFHIHEGMELFSNVRNFWCFPGERLILRLRGIPVNHKIGELESTLLHSFCKGASFRRLTLNEDCPPLLKHCFLLIEKAYGL